jgi:hypothetical protein
MSNGLKIRSSQNYLGWAVKKLINMIINNHQLIQKESIFSLAPCGTDLRKFHLHRETKTGTLKAPEANRKRGPGTREKVRSKRINLEGNTHAQEINVSQPYLN